MKFSAVIAVVASLAMVDATPVLDRRAPRPPNNKANVEAYFKYAERKKKLKLKLLVLNLMKFMKKKMLLKKPLCS
jgi:hypothetical protein